MEKYQWDAGEIYKKMWDQGDVNWFGINKHRQ
jgi:hypothetical protein